MTIQTKILKDPTEVTSGFGNRTYKNAQGVTVSDYHPGLDLGVAYKPFWDWKPGKVRIANVNDAALGNWLVIEHDDGTASLFGHLSQMNVKVGDRVAVGQILGITGATGNVTGAHLHYEYHTSLPKEIMSYSVMVPSAIDPMALITGNALAVPAANGKVQKSYTLTSADADGLGAVAGRLGVTMSQLIDWNKNTYPTLISNPDHIEVGWDLVYYVPAPAAVTDDKDLQTAKKAQAMAEQKLADANVAAAQAAQQAAEAAAVNLAQVQADADAKVEDAKAQLAAYQHEVGLQVQASQSGVAIYATQVIEQTVNVDGLLQRWANFVDTHFKSSRLQSILKYDVFVVIGWILSAPTLGVWLNSSGISTRIAGALAPSLDPVLGLVNGLVTGLPTHLTSQGITIFILTLASIVFKLLVTRYDTDYNGRLDLADTQELKSVFTA